MVRTADAAILLDLLMTVSGEVDSLPQSPVEISRIDKDEAGEVLASSIRHSILTGAFSEGRMIGMCSIVPVSAEVRRKHVGAMFIAVRKEVWERGVSTHLAEYAMDMAREKGIRKVEISVVGENEKTMEFLSGLGFFEEGRNLRALSIDGSFIDSVRYAAFLD